MMRWVCLALMGALLAAAPGWGKEAPVAVSPGSEDGALIEDRCPTFSWGEVEGARGYELVIYRLGEESDEAVPVLRQSFAGNVDGWTPALDSCLERGSRYAWSIRAQLGQELSEWSAPSLFQVSSGPTAEEFAEALQVVRQYLGETSRRNGGVLALPAESAAPGQLEGLGAPAEAPAAAVQEVLALSASGPESVGVAELSVEGEVRTLSPGGAPRVWGRGRPGAERYGQPRGGGPCDINGILIGLSKSIVPLGSVADACPAGTWVCTREEQGIGIPCQSACPDGAIDARDCDYNIIDWDATEHRGWLAGAPNNEGAGTAAWENGSESPTLPSCNRYPVWCCSE
jgi:hypothetical protein